MSFIDPVYDTLANQTLAGQELADALMGPTFMGWMMNIFLFGLVVARFWDYVVNSELYEDDPRTTKGVLLSVMALCTASVGVSVGQAYHYGTSQVRNTYALTLGVPLDSLPPVLTGLLACIVQVFLTLRCSQLLRDRKMLRRLFIVAVLLMAVVAFLFSLAVTVMFALGSAGSTNLSFYVVNTTTGIWLWISAGVDSSITIALYFAIRDKIVGFNASTDTMIRKLIKLSVETMALTTACAVLGALMAVVFPREGYNTVNILFAFTFALPSLYTLSLLVTLNGRGKIKRAGNTTWKNTVASTVASPNHAEIFVLHDVQTHTDRAYQQPWEGRNSNSGHSRSVPKHDDPRIGEEKKQRFAEPHELEA